MNNLYKAIALDNNPELENLILAKAAKHLKDRGSINTWDLYPFFAILVSSGINKNSDAFDPQELWIARNSPTDKPINIGHKQTRIIGHMTDSIVVGEDLKPIPENTNEGDLPYKLHIVLAGVIYKIWEDPFVQAEVNDLINKISKGQTFVSMECLFKNFDFLLTHASTNEQKIITRNDKTAGLTKYLAQYKGPGKIHDYALARLLRNITFSAVAIVDKPANPDSIISASLDIFSLANAFEKENVYIKLDSQNGDNNMSDKSVATTDGGGFSHDYKVEDHPQYQALHNEHTALKHAHESLKDDHERMKKDHSFLHDRVSELNGRLNEVHQRTLSSDKMPEGKDQPKTPVEKERDSANPDKNMPNPTGTGKKTLKGPDKSTYASEGASMADTTSDTDTTKEMAALRAEVEKLTAKVNDLEKDKKEVEKEKAELATANDAMSATLNEFKKASRHSDRAEALMKIDSGLTREKAIQTVAKFDEMNDATFACTIELMKGYADRAPREVTAKEIVNTAKAEKDINYGAKAENTYEKVTADVKNFIKGVKANSKEKGA